MLQNEPNVSIIGIGDDGLAAVPEAVRSVILQADVVAGNERVLGLVEEVPGERHVLAAVLQESVDAIAAMGDKRVAVLVSGDPLFYGLARYLCESLGPERCEIVPHVSSMQLAFARVKESWDEAYLTDLTNHSLETVVDKVRVAQKAGLFTTEDCTPSDVAVALLNHRIDYFTAYVCENLGARDERVTRGTLGEIAEQKFDPLNVMILIREDDAPDQVRTSDRRSLFGNPEEMFVQSVPKQGLLTPAEVRSIALAQMALHARSIVWDVGAGSGSVSVEAGLLAPGGTVYAIEQDPEDEDLIRQNAQRFGVLNVKPVLGRAPDVWADLPDPDAVFIEGSGREVSRIAEAAFERLTPGGRLVVNLGSIEGLSEVRGTLAKRTAQLGVWMVNVARGTDQLVRLRLDALNPCFLLAASKPADGNGSA